MVISSIPVSHSGLPHNQSANHTLDLLVMPVHPSTGDLCKASVSISFCLLPAGRTGSQGWPDFPLKPWEDTVLGRTVKNQGEHRFLSFCLEGCCPPPILENEGHQMLQQLPGPRGWGILDPPPWSQSLMTASGRRAKVGTNEQHVTMSVIHIQAADPLATLGHICLKHRGWGATSLPGLLPNYHCRLAAAQGPRPQAEDTGSSPGFGLNSR